MNQHLEILGAFELEFEKLGLGVDSQESIVFQFHNIYDQLGFVLYLHVLGYLPRRHMSSSRRPWPSNPSLLLVAVEDYSGIQSFDSNDSISSSQNKQHTKFILNSGTPSDFDRTTPPYPWLSPSLSASRTPAKGWAPWHHPEIPLLAHPPSQFPISIKSTSSKSHNFTRSSCGGLS